MELTLGEAFNRPIFMVDAIDHITGLPGLTLTITASKNGAAFASITPTVTDRGNGWYTLALTTSHTDTEGALAFHITSVGADPLDFADQVMNPADLSGSPGPPTLAEIMDAIIDYLENTTHAMIGQEEPPEEVSLAYMLRLRYKRDVCLQTESATLQRLYNYLGTVVDQKFEVSENETGTLTTRGRLVSGP